MHGIFRFIPYLIIAASAGAVGCVEDESTGGGADAVGRADADPGDARHDGAADLSPAAAACTAAGTDAFCRPSPEACCDGVFEALTCLEAAWVETTTAAAPCAGDDECARVIFGHCRQAWAVAQDVAGRANTIASRINACQVGFDFGPCGAEPEDDVVVRCVEGRCAVAPSAADAGAGANLDADLP